MTRTLRSTAFLALSLFVSAAAGAATFTVPNDLELIRRADAIAIARAQSQEPKFNSGGGIETVTVFEAEAVLKGDFFDRVFEVHEPGGTIGETSAEITGAPRFEMNRRYVLFLTRTPRGVWAVTDLVLGKFAFVRDLLGQELLLREELEILGWEPDGSPHIERRRDAARFLAFIRGNLAPVPKTSNADYIVEQAPLARDDRGALGTRASSLRQESDATAASYMMPCGASGCRWSSFGSGMPWYNQNTEPGAPNGGITAIQQSFAGWNDECGSQIHYVYAGTNSAAVGGLSAPDGINAIRFESSLAEHGVTPYVCGAGGTIAVGGISRASGTHRHPVTGETMSSTIEGDVVGNIGLANCSSFLSSGDFITALEHEFGHTLGFRHSDSCPAGGECTSSAVMNSVIVRGLNGQLQQWDINAARTVYPGGSCNPAPPPSPASGVRGDFNGDGQRDILLRDSSTGRNSVWMFSGLTLAAVADLPALPDTNFRAEGTSYFNRDGRTDILFRNYANGRNAVWIMNGLTLSSIADLPALPNTSMHVEGTGDFDGDGNADILWRNYTTGQNAIWLMSGTALRSVVDLPALPNTAFRMESAGDFNGDGSLDIVLRNYVTGQNAVWLMSRTTFTGIADLPALPNTSYRIDAVADFTAEGKPDLVWRNYANGANAIWIMNNLTLASTRDLPALANVSWEIKGPR